MEKNEILTLLNRVLLNYYIESFGIFNQTLSIVFRKDNHPETTVIIHISTSLHSSILIKGLYQMEEDLLNIAKVNLACVTEIHLENDNNLVLYFDNAQQLTIKGISEDGYPEVWQINQNTRQNKNYLSLIAMSGGGTAVWDYLD